MAPVGEQLLVYATSTGRDPRGFSVGRDLVLQADPRHVVDLPRKVLADDHLDPAARRHVDRVSRDIRDAWQSAASGLLTISDVCFPWVWRLELLAGVVRPSMHLAESVRHALRDVAPTRLSLVGLREPEAALVTAVAEELGIAVSSQPSPPVSVPDPAAAPFRRRALAAARRFGIPAFLRSGDALVLGYWHLAPLIDRMLLDGWRPTVSIQALPPGPRRSLRAAARGGFAGSPGPLTRRQARRLAAVPLLELGSFTPSLPGVGPSLERCLDETLARFAAERLAADLANALMWQRLFRRRRFGVVVVPNDHMPDPRLVVGLAQQFGIPTLGFQHGVYVPTTPEVPEDPIDDRVEDLEVVDHVAAWSKLSACALGRPEDTVSVVGYPLPRLPETGRARVDGDAPRFVVLVPEPERITTLVPSRAAGDYSVAAVRAILRRFPKAEVTLRPHPASGMESIHAARMSFPDADIAIDKSSDIVELLRKHDVCIGSKSTATYQAALEGCSVVVLNLTGSEWKWPLGGDTPVPVARSEEELETALVRVVADGDAPGRDALLLALGDPDGDTSGRLLGLVAALRRSA
jgi:hypothetical protein